MTKAMRVGAGILVAGAVMGMDEDGANLCVDAGGGFLQRAPSDQCDNLADVCLAKAAAQGRAVLALIDGDAKRVPEVIDSQLANAREFLGWKRPNFERRRGVSGCCHAAIVTESDICCWRFSAVASRLVQMTLTAEGLA